MEAKSKLLTSLKKTFLLFVSLSLISCQRILEQKIYNETRKNYTSPFQGNWVGTYTGPQEGKLQFTVYKSGSMEVKRFFDNNQVETFYGSVYDNGIIMNVYSESGFLINGGLLSKNGIWKYGNYNGTWTIAKQ